MRNMFRKSLYAILILSMLLAVSITPVFAEEHYQDLTQYEVEFDGEMPNTALFVVNCNEWISVWKESRSGSERIGILPLGARINYWTPLDEDFILFKLPGSGYGYVSWKYLSYDFEDAATLYVTNCDSWVSLWAEPAVGSERIMKVPKGTKIEYWSPYSREFVVCDMGGDGGFISWDYLAYSRK